MKIVIKFTIQPAVNTSNMTMFVINGHQCSISIPSRCNPFNVLNYDKYDNNQLDHNEITNNISVILDDNKKPKCVGVVYRPPSGIENLALQELDLLMKNIPNENVTITGDFNIDLLSKNSDFEQIFYSNNFIPLISIGTHEKPGCKGSLIINILTNSTDNFVSSGVLESRVSHHHPVFCCFNSCNGVPKQPDTPTPPHYDYCQTNISKFLDDVKNGINVQEFNYDEEGFNFPVN